MDSTATQYIDEILQPVGPVEDPPSNAIPERVLWCEVLRRLFEDLKVIMDNCNQGIESGYYDGRKLWFFDERAKLEKYIYTDDFLIICDHASVCYWKLFFKFKEMLELNV